MISFSTTRRRTIAAFATLLSIVTLVGGLQPPAAAPFTFAPIDVPGAVATGGLGVNDAGDVVGVSSDATDNFGGFVRSGGMFTPIAVPGALFASPIDINNTGDIVGTFLDATGRMHGFLLRGGAFTTIDFPGAGATALLGINDGSQIVGTFNVGPILDAVGRRGFLLSASTFTPIDVPGADVTSANGINNAGQIVGTFGSLAEGVVHTFFLDEGRFSQIDVPGVASPPPGTAVSGPGTQGFGINTAAQIAGFFTDTAGVHGFVLDEGRFTRIDVDLPGTGSTQVTGINDAGQLVGIFGDAAAPGHGFLATPVPEPSTFMLAISALGLVYRFARRKK